VCCSKGYLRLRNVDELNISMDENNIDPALMYCVEEIELAEE